LTRNKSNISPWLWIPSLYFAEGLPYIIVMTVSVIMYKRLGISNTDIALYTSWLYLPWVIKPLWSPFVDILRTKRFWIISMQLMIGLALTGIAFTLHLPLFFTLTLFFLWISAFASATHDIAADGFYMLGLDYHDQAWFVGVRSTFYRFAMIAGSGLLVIFAGYLETSTGKVPLAWSITFIMLAVVMTGFSIYHKFILPFPATDSGKALINIREILKDYFNVLVEFFKKDRIVIIITFLLFYRFGEAQLVKLASPFLLDTRQAGGLALSTTQVGFIYGTVGLILLSVGGILGGFLTARHGLKFWLFPMAVAMNLPNAVYVYLSYVQPEQLWIVNACVAIEQFGYGFGFTAYMLFMIMVSEGKHKTAHFAITTGFMALGMMLPGMFSGWLQEQIGYQHFFIWILIATIPGFILLPFLPIDKNFGRKQ
jgi:MFS transporter, PAT family, beta-lactamase induction signal transducer AmpG